MGNQLFGELFDQYTWLHFAVGFMSGSIPRMTLTYTIILHTIFEIFKNSDIGLQFINEFYIKFKTYWSIQTKNSFINSVGGTIATILGWITARVIQKKLHVKFDLNNLNYRNWLFYGGYYGQFWLLMAIIWFLIHHK